MKKIILLACVVLALLAPGISKAQSYTIPNGSFESWVSGSSTQPNDWKIVSGQVEKFNSVEYYTISNTTPPETTVVNRPAVDGSTCIALANAVVGSSLERGIMYDSFPFTGKPAYMGMNYAYFGSGSEAFEILVVMTRWNSTTHQRDTLLKATYVPTAGNALPWSNITDFTLNYSSTVTGNPDSCRIYVVNTIASQSTQNTGIYIDEMYFSDGVPTGIATMATFENGVSVYPNPFAGTTNITYSLKIAGQVSLAVYDVNGKEVANLVNENQGTGAHQVTFDGAGLKNGLYIYKLQSGDAVETGKIMLNR